MYLIKEFFKMLFTSSNIYKKEQDQKFQDELAELNYLAKTTGNTPAVEN